MSSPDGEEPFERIVGTSFTDNEADDMLAHGVIEGALGQLDFAVATEDNIKEDVAAAENFYDEFPYSIELSGFSVHSLAMQHKRNVSVSPKGNVIIEKPFGRGHELRKMRYQSLDEAIAVAKRYPDHPLFALFRESEEASHERPSAHGGVSATGILAVRLTTAISHIDTLTIHPNIDASKIYPLEYLEGSHVGYDFFSADQKGHPLEMFVTPPQIELPPLNRTRFTEIIGSLYNIESGGPLSPDRNRYSKYDARVILEQMSNLPVLATKNEIDFVDLVAPELARMSLPLNATADELADKTAEIIDQLFN